MKPSGLAKKFSLKSKKAAAATSKAKTIVEEPTEEEKPVVFETDAIMESRDAEETDDVRKQDPAQMEDIDDKEEQNCDKFIVEDREEARDNDFPRQRAENSKKESADQKDDDSVVTEVANEAGEPVDKALSTVKEESNEDETVHDAEANDKPIEDEPTNVDPNKTCDEYDAQDDAEAKDDSSFQGSAPESVEGSYHGSVRSRAVGGNASIDCNTYVTSDDNCSSPAARTSFCGFSHCFGGGLN